jgi:1,4-alpha-glucan branching enzyme
MKWMMGWMHDTLDYFSKDPIYRKHHQNEITFSLAYAFTENFMLPLSHDEVVYGKQSLLNKMPGDEWQKFANLRLLYGYMFAHPGTNLVFMGGEFGQSAEWNFANSLDWHLLDYKPHKGLQSFFKDLNTFYKNTPALYEKAFSQEGFEWINYGDYENSVIAFIRKGHDQKNDLIVVCNFTTVVRKDYKIGLPRKGSLAQVLNSDLKKYFGSGISNTGKIKVVKKEMNGKPYCAAITLPPLGIVAFQYE